MKSLRGVVKSGAFQWGAMGIAFFAVATFIAVYLPTGIPVNRSVMAQPRDDGNQPYVSPDEKFYWPS